jgi:hypothetical protein
MQVDSRRFGQKVRLFPVMEGVSGSIDSASLGEAPLRMTV